jgi:hypothetical protein
MLAALKNSLESSVDPGSNGCKESLGSAFGAVIPSLTSPSKKKIPREQRIQFTDPALPASI